MMVVVATDELPPTYVCGRFGIHSGRCTKFIPYTCPICTPCHCADIPSLCLEYEDNKCCTDLNTCKSSLDAKIAALEEAIKFKSATIQELEEKLALLSVTPKNTSLHPIYDSIKKGAVHILSTAFVGLCTWACSCVTRASRRNDRRAVGVNHGATQTE